jgi:RimJ/RimL family protein N-acetyltransferase
VKLRRVTFEDSKMIFEWANDPDTRANSALSDPIPWEDHERWYAERLADEDSDLLIALTDDEVPVGIVRFQSQGDQAEISVNVAPSHRGGGLGVEMIGAGCEEFFRIREVPLVVAYIRPGNVASQRAFGRAGFRPAGEERVRGAQMLRYERAR